MKLKKLYYLSLSLVFLGNILILADRENVCDETNMELTVEYTDETMQQFTAIEEQRKLLEEEWKDQVLSSEVKELYEGQETQETREQFAIVKRYMECLTFKGLNLGKFAFNDTPADFKEIHYIITGIPLDNISQLLQEEAIDDLIIFNHIFKEHKGFLTDYERNKMAEDARGQYAKEMASFIMWQAIAFKKNLDAFQEDNIETDQNGENSVEVDLPNTEGKTEADLSGDQEKDEN